jgi:hypothetical protein
VPVILVVLDPKLGFSAGDTREGLIGTIRRLFIDLNKHAEKVSRARQILLDDRDPASICVRALIGGRLVAGDEELANDVPSLPLSLIDWHSERALFSDGPYLTTILGTDWAVSKILGIRPFEDPMAFDAVGKLIKRLEARLDIELDTATKRLDDCRKYEKPFSFVDEPENELELIGSGFKEKWSRAIIQLLTKLSPYGRLIDERRLQESLTPEFANWYSIKQSADESGGARRASDFLADYEKELAGRDDPIAPSDLKDALSACEEVKTKYPLAFTVVFQRALFLAYLQFVKISQSMIDRLSGDDDVEIEDYLEDDDAEDIEEEVTHESDRAELLVEALNKIISEEPEFLNRDYEFPRDIETNENYDRFWICSFATPEGPIDFTQSASGRAADLLLLVGVLHTLIRNFEDGELDATDVWNEADESSSGIWLKLQQCLGRMWSSDQSIAARILRNREQDESDKNKQEEVYLRLSWIWEILNR